MNQLSYTAFRDIFFPPDEEGQESSNQLALEKVRRFQPPLATNISASPLVIFDFETTGLDTKNDHIIEIGGLKTQGGVIIEEFETLIKPPVPLTSTVINITGITEELLVGQPTIDGQLQKFLRFIDGSILVAHNADFDMAFLRSAAARLGIQLEWPGFCTLKMARNLLPDLESRTLDSLAEHYNLTFESRHRSIGDCKVTSSVLQSMLKDAFQDQVTWQALQPYTAK